MGLLLLDFQFAGVCRVLVVCYWWFGWWFVHLVFCGLLLVSLGFDCSSEGLR